MNKRAVARAALIVLLGFAMLLAYGERQALNADVVEAWVKSAGALGPLAFMAVYAAATVLFMPGAVLTLAGGALFGPVWGALYSLVGATVGATVAYLIARFLAADWVARKAGPRLTEVIQGVGAEGWRFVAFVRLVPLFPFNLLNYILGLTRISPIQYVAASFVCMAPGALAYSYLGYFGREAMADGNDLVSKLLLATALLAGVAFLPRLLQRVRSPVERLSAADLKLRLATGQDLTVLDVRSMEDYAGELGHISPSLNIPLDQLTGRLSELEQLRERPVAVICRTNRMSFQAVEMLRRAGFRKVKLVADGMLAWRELAKSR